MELTGSLRRFAVASVFQLLSMEGATGTLTLRRGRVRIIITLKGGDVLDAEHSGNPKEKRMQSILVEGDRITEDVWDVILEEQKLRLIPIGSVLNERGLISNQDFSTLVRLIVRQIIFEALEWRDGVYDFKRLDAVEPGELSEPLSMQNILLNAAQEEDEWSQIKRYVPSLKNVFAPSPTDTVGWSSALASMPPEERRIAELIDGTRTVRRIACELIRSDFDVAHLIMELSQRGLVQRVALPAEQEEEEAKFLSLRIGPAAVWPLIIAFTILMSLHLWKYYVEPFFRSPDEMLLPLAHGGRDMVTVDKLRLQRVRDAFQLYYEERGTLPTSLQELAEEGFCSESDLRTIGGGDFVFKVFGSTEGRAIIQATDAEGKVRPELTAELAVQ